MSDDEQVGDFPRCTRGKILLVVVSIKFRYCVPPTEEVEKLNLKDGT